MNKRLSLLSEFLNHVGSMSYKHTCPYWVGRQAPESPERYQYHKGQKRQGGLRIGGMVEVVPLELGLAVGGRRELTAGGRRQGVGG